MLFLGKRFDHLFIPFSGESHPRTSEARDPTSDMTRLVLVFQLLRDERSR
jgi:hypothetical protein